MSDDKAPPPDHAIILCWEQVRDALNLYIEKHGLVKPGGYRVRFTQFGEPEGTNVRVEFWKDSSG